MKTLVKVLLLTFTWQNVSYAGGVETCEPTIIYKDRIVEVEKEVYFLNQVKVEKNVTKKNRLSLLLSNGPSNDVSTTTGPLSTTLAHEDDNAAGILYQRDLKRFVLGGYMDTNENVGISLGVNW